MPKNKVGQASQAKKKAKSILFYLFVIFIGFMTVMPLIYLVSISMSSLIEINDFPKEMVPSFSHNVEFTYEERYEAYVIWVELYEENDETGRYEKVLDDKILIYDTALDDGVTWIERQLNVSISEEELLEIMLPAKETGEPVETKLYKDVFSNFEKFFTLSGSFETWSEFWRTPVPRAFLNSVKAALYTIILALSIGGSLGYALARTKIKGKDAIGIGALVVRMFPTIAISVSAAVMLINFGLFDSMFGLAVIYAIPNIGLTAWITRGIFMGVNKELEEASLVFGASKLQTFTKITLPLVLPAFAASSMYAFITAWNDTGVALLLTNNNSTLSLELYGILGGPNSIHYAAAGSLVLILPAAFFTFYLRKYINQLWG